MWNIYLEMIFFNEFRLHFHWYTKDGKCGLLLLKTWHRNFISRNKYTKDKVNQIPTIITNICIIFRISKNNHILKFQRKLMIFFIRFITELLLRLWQLPEYQQLCKYLHSNSICLLNIENGNFIYFTLQWYSNIQIILHSHINECMRRRIGYVRSFPNELAFKQSKSTYIAGSSIPVFKYLNNFIKCSHCHNSYFENWKLKSNWNVYFTPN